MGLRIDVCGDISDQFEFLKEQLIYVDAPLEGFVRAKNSGDPFAFRCVPAVRGCLWHWVLVPVHSTKESVARTFEKARTAPPHQWISILEDRRGDEPQLGAVWLTGSEYEIPNSWQRGDWG